jgi:5'-3' exonuclease/transcription antitermination factor NusG
VGLWVVLETVVRSEQPDPEAVRKAILRILPGIEVFVPAAVSQVGSDKVTTYLLEGYVFVRYDRVPSEYFKLDGTKYIQNVLLSPGNQSRNKRISTVSDVHILKMREQIKQLVDKGISIGDTVMITSGPYRNMTAVVLEDFPEEKMVQVHIGLRSKQSLISFPRSFLTVVSKSPLSTVLSHLKSLQDWIRIVDPIMTWESSMEPLHQSYKAYVRSVGFFERSLNLIWLRLFSSLIPARLADIYKQLNVLIRWESVPERLNQLAAFVHVYESRDMKDMKNLGAKLEHLIWLEGVLNRIQTLWDDVDKLSKSSTRKGKVMNRNVLVDGHNLAFRCLYAPGLVDLRGSQSRPTGMILGVLRSLASLKKRFPEATLMVAWDGSSQRRKRKFSDYKANRKAHEAVAEGSFDPLGFIKAILPLLGVPQVWNPKEEADDVIATLVRGKLKDDINIVFSTDRDLLQLVTDTTHLLVPPVGSRNEILFDPEAVQESMGVPPDKIVELRALYGDTSDNIPGVPRVPKKVLRDLIQAHGSVDGLYRSGLAGLNKGQYERLRSAEPQVRINLDLTTLVDVVVSTTPSDVDPDRATMLLRELNINPSNILDAFFGNLPP